MGNIVAPKIGNINLPTPINIHCEFRSSILSVRRNIKIEKNELDYLIVNVKQDF